MKIDFASWKKMKKIEWVLFILFLFFLLFPISIPPTIAPWIDNTLGIALLLILAIYLLFVVHPFVGVLFLFVTFELIRRAGLQSHKTIPLSNHTVSHTVRERDLKRMNPPKELTLEEETVIQYGVYENQPATVVENTTFQPVYDKVTGTLI
jgi:uncharacterized membrane protein